MHVAIIGGGGTIGSTVAYRLATGAVAPDVTIIDIDEDAAFGHATDIRHATCMDSIPLGKHKSEISGGGTVRYASPTPDAVSDADCLVVTASAPRPEGGAKRGGRMTFLELNRNLVEEIGDWLHAVDPRPTICVTNPMDRITYALWQATGWPREQIIGYSLSETARLGDWLAREYDVPSATISCPILGEHGENVVPVFSRLIVDGEHRSVDADRRQAALDYIRDIPYDIIQRRGAEESSRWVTANGVRLLVEALLTEPPVTPIDLSVPLDGEYGFHDVCLSVPVVLDSNGWTRIEEWDLSTWEADRLDAAYRSVAESIHGTTG